MAHDWGRFTVRGSSEVEATLSSLLDEAASTVTGVLPQDEFRALVLIGGYGRGEGGVEITDGRERPHNNLDFLLIVRGDNAQRQNSLRDRVQEAVAPLAQRYGVDIDVSAVSDSKLSRSPCLVMWYDMRFGNKTILGDASFVPSLKRFRLERIPAWDIRNLLINRGTLLTINNQMLIQPNPDKALRKTVVKHAMKGIIGYGDAILFFLGNYHWSYFEKLQRMKKEQAIPKDFRDLYEKAAEFRFRPDYAPYLAMDISEWMSGILKDCVKAHLVCESKRLEHDGLDWTSFAESCTGHALFDDLASPRECLKKAYNFLRVRQAPGALSSKARLGFRVMGSRGILALTHPIVTYRLEEVGLRQLAAAALKTSSSDWDTLRLAYLRLWAQVNEVALPCPLPPVSKEGAVA